MNTIQIQNISIAELRTIIQEIVSAEFTKVLNVTSNSPPDDNLLLSKQQAAAYLRISVPTLMKMVKEKQLKGVKVNKRIKFKKSNLNLQ
jgi:excisionase family DNA binding protein